MGVQPIVTVGGTKHSPDLVVNAFLARQGCLVAEKTYCNHRYQSGLRLSLGLGLLGRRKEETTLSKKQGYEAGLGGRVTRQGYEAGLGVTMTMLR